MKKSLLTLVALAAFRLDDTGNHEPLSFQLLAQQGASALNG